MVWPEYDTVVSPSRVKRYVAGIAKPIKTVSVTVTVSVSVMVKVSVSVIVTVSVTITSSVTVTVSSSQLRRKIRLAIPP